MLRMALRLALTFSSSARSAALRGGGAARAAKAPAETASAKDMAAKTLRIPVM
jgi:hypothetical protein